jgi:hypothetical protein
MNFDTCADKRQMTALFVLAILGIPLQENGGCEFQKAKENVKSTYRTESLRAFLNRRKILLSTRILMSTA